MTTTIPHTFSQLADIGAKAAHHTLDGSSLVCVSPSFELDFKQDAPAREAFVKAVLDAVGYKFPVNPECEAFVKWYEESDVLEGDYQAYLTAWKAGREELRKAQRLAKEPAQTENDGWIDWPGGDCPVDRNVTVQVQYRADDFGDTGNACSFRWNHSGKASDIIAYKIVTP
jgi:hypothetical protein